jgi:hypothetical protein
MGWDYSFVGEDPNVGHLAVAGEGRMRMKPTQNRRWKGAGF